ncbi:MAG: Rieske 2Fe-2S domain-containing protein [Endozoicomonas sp.]
MEKRYNKPIPYGWYAVGYSKDLAVGDVKPIKYFGEELVLFRTESGKASVLDAYCPHLGAHLGHGGIVKGESVSCPFHAWQFDGTGTVTEIPYAKRMPPKVKGKPCIKSYKVVERNQMIWAWYHPYDAEPMYEVETVKEIGHDDWSEVASHSWDIPSIIQETGENAADLAHFITVHGMPELPEGEVIMEGHRRTTEFDGNSSSINDDGSVNNSNIEAMHLLSVSNGPGQSYQKFSRLFDVVMMATITPIDDQNIRMTFNFTLPKMADPIKKSIAEGMSAEICRQVEQDIPIWVHKKYVATPILCDGDGPIGQYRKWFQQFYATEPAAETARKEQLIATA